MYLVLVYSHLTLFLFGRDWVRSRFTNVFDNVRGRLTLFLFGHDW